MKQYHALNFEIDSEVLLTNLNEPHVFFLNRGKSKNELIAWGNSASLILEAGAYNAEQVENFITDNTGDYIFCTLSYDIKNNITRTQLDPKPEKQPQNDIELVVPQHVLVRINGKLIYFGSKEIPPVILALQQLPPSISSRPSKNVHLTPRTSKADYLNNVAKILGHIQHGDIYEMNYCVNFNGSFDEFDPITNYFKLHSNSYAPFSAYFKSHEQHILSASPERFIQKRETTLTSQPIKGTARRGNTPQEDETLKNELKNNPKEISENVMIVDLVRNDLSRIAEKKSVVVPELCKLYTFDTVHQLISTVTGTINDQLTFTQIIEALFPMGSMTGAPKVSAMQIINGYETFNRGTYSGALGYIAPNGNFDFNVVIRTLLANTKSKTLSTSVGGAITIKSSPDSEYNECLLKLAVIKKSVC